MSINTHTRFKTYHTKTTLAPKKTVAKKTVLMRKMELGQVVHGACLVAIFGYTLAVAAHALGFATLSSFGEHWAEDGFCVSFKDDPMMNSHMLCMFADSTFALILLYISLTSKKTGVREVRENVLSVFLHGMAHASLFFLSAPPPHGAGIDWSTEPPLLRAGTGDKQEKYEALAAAIGVSSNLLLLLVALSQFIFWFGFLATMTAWSRPLALVQSVLHAVALVSIVPPFWFFTYVNTFLFVNIVGSKMIVAARPEGSPASGLRGRNHDIYACLVSLPILLATFGEPLFCDSFLFDWGGHVWFDSTIPVGVLVYYCVVSRGDGVEKERRKKVV
jgi:hypothetical protein